MTYTGVEITTEAELDTMYADLVSTYATSAEVPEGVVICPQLNLFPHPSFNTFLAHLANPAVRVLSVVDDTTGKHTIIGIWANTHAMDWHLTAVWGPSDRQVKDDCWPAWGEFLEAEGHPIRLYTNTKGWVTRMWFEDYMPQTGGPFDCTIHQPGLPEGETYDVWDDEVWYLTISRPTPDASWEWTAALLRS